MSNYKDMTANPELVLEPMKFIGWLQQIETGKMINNGSLTVIANPGESVEIKEGFYNGFGVIRVKTLLESTIGDATPGSIIKGKTLWVNGELITGTMDTGTSSSDPSEHYVGSSFDGESLRIEIDNLAYTEDINLVSITSEQLWNLLSPYVDLDKIKAGHTVVGSQGLGRFTSDANATAQNIKTGNNGYVNGNILYGTLDISTLY